MKKEELIRLVDEIANLNHIDIKDIPDINLYMDQVLTFIEENLSEYKREEKQKIITKSMINNYTKHKMIASPIKKKYNKNHILSLILIYHLKSILSINDITLLLNDKTDNIESIYKEFLENRNNTELSDEISKMLDKNYELDETKLFSLILELIEQANQRKLLVEKIIDIYFKN